ncbi:uncharacterized protein LOC139921945 [Centroberyx gerrardi]|uniref:uncharacterized protein n=1 Tax=Centroberyx gerrardi TaxID=166262 RepID=UPI003AAFEF5E
MKTSSACILVFIQLIVAHAEVVFIRRTESQSLELSCSAQQAGGTLTGLHLYHRGTHSQLTLLSVAEGGELRVDLQHRGRLEVSGGLGSQRVNLTVSHLQYADTGLYVWELTYRADNSTHHSVLADRQVFLLVEGAGRPCRCSPTYRPLLCAIFTAMGLLLLILSWLGIDICVKTKHRHTPQPPVPIYEEMDRKQQSTGTPQNNHEAPSHLEEANFPVYANPNIRQTQDNYYACPRQIAPRV